MNVRELKAKLDKFPDDTEVWHISTGGVEDVVEVVHFERSVRSGKDELFLL